GPHPTGTRWGSGVQFRRRVWLLGRSLAVGAHEPVGAGGEAGIGHQFPEAVQLGQSEAVGEQLVLLLQRVGVVQPASVAAAGPAFGVLDDTYLAQTGLAHGGVGVVGPADVDAVAFQDLLNCPYD